MLKKKKYAKNVAEEDGPDWGGLKHVERPEGESEDGAKKVIIKFFSEFNLYSIIMYHMTNYG